MPANTDGTATMKLAEANYTIYIISTKTITIESYGSTFLQEAYRLMTHLRDHADSNLALAVGPQSTTTGIEPKFTRSKFDADGIHLGNKPGIADGNKGSLDDW